MAKPIYVERDDIESILQELRARILGSKYCDKSIEIKHDFKRDNRRAELVFTTEAWIKMTALVARFETEVQWHGLVRRTSESSFVIYDIIVPPHEVTGTTVISDAEKYTNWINDLDDETFAALRFHGHSHVNMGVFASSTDTDYRKNVVTQLPKPSEQEDTFYIFLIINKKYFWSAEIFDLTNNAVYSTEAREIDLSVPFSDGTSLDLFVAEAKAVAVEVATPVTGYAYSYGGKNYSGYRTGGYTPPAKGYTTPAKGKSDNTSKSKKVYNYYEDGFYDDEGSPYPVEEDDSSTDTTDPFYSKDGRWW